MESIVVIKRFTIAGPAAKTYGYKIPGIYLKMLNVNLF